MNRVFEELNEMSFDLPEGWNVSTDKYNLMNGQGFINIENYTTYNQGLTRVNLKKIVFAQGIR